MKYLKYITENYNESKGKYWDYGSQNQAHPSFENEYAIDLENIPNNIKRDILTKLNDMGYRWSLLAIDVKSKNIMDDYFVPPKLHLYPFRYLIIGTENLRGKITPAINHSNILRDPSIIISVDDFLNNK